MSSAPSDRASSASASDTAGPSGAERPEPVGAGLSRRRIVGAAALPLVGALTGVPAAHAAPGEPPGERPSPASGTAAAPASGLVTEDVLLPSGEPGIDLYLRNKRPANLTRFSAERTLLFVHGASQGSEVTFDLALDGLSWADYIAGRGWDVWLVDIRGYGKSGRPPDAGEPVARTETAWKDFGTAADYILGRRAIARLNTLGWSWGSVITGGWASRNPDKIGRLAFFGANWPYRTPKPDAATPAYVTWTVREAFDRLQAGAPADKRAALTPPAWYKAWEDLAIETDGQVRPANADTPLRLRSPAGIWADIADLTRRDATFYDPATIRAPTLLAVGEWDAAVKGSRELFGLLTSAPEKQLVELGGATHFAHLERNRFQLYRAVQAFLEG